MKLLTPSATDVRCRPKITKENAAHKTKEDKSAETRLRTGGVIDT
jgi:hypothetical protein